MKDLKNYNLSNNNVDEDIARAISMDELFEKVKEHIHELYQNRNYENKNNSHAGSIEVFQQTN